MAPIDPIPPVTAAEGWAKLILGTGAGLLLLYFAWYAGTGQGALDNHAVAILSGFLLAFLGVDVLSIAARLSRHERRAEEYPEYRDE